jgi:hypothetical protein
MKWDFISLSPQSIFGPFQKPVKLSQAPVIMWLIYPAFVLGRCVTSLDAWVNLGWSNPSHLCRTTTTLCLLFEKLSPFTFNAINLM